MIRGHAHGADFVLHSDARGGPAVIDDPDTQRAWVDIDLDALVANARTVARVSGSRLLPMVKANGYGLGAIEIARALEAADPWGVGVGTVEEGVALRSAGFGRPILLVTPLIPDWVDALLAARIRPLIGDVTVLDCWAARSDAPFHVDIDTGMGRSGIRWDDRAGLDTLARRLADLPSWEGVATHFHSPDDAAATERQWERFGHVLAALPRRPPLIHAANSAAALAGHRYAADLVRPGIFLYGGMAAGAVPEPVAALRARVVAIRSVPAGETVSYGATWRADRPTMVATLAVGYADGFPRATGGDVGAAPPSGPNPERRLRFVELDGQRVQLVGRVTMDMCMVAAPEGVRLGDVATVYGGLVSLDEQAAASRTISYELLTSIGPRVPRRYHRT